MMILPQVIIYAIILFFTAALFILTWSRRKAFGGNFLLLHLTALAIWVFGLLFEAISQTVPDKILWSQFSYIGFTTTTPFLILFIISYSQQRHLNWRFTLLFLIVPFLTTLAAYTNDQHHLLWTNFHWGSTQYNILIYEHGVVFYLHLVYIYTLVFFGLGLLAQKISRSKPPFRSQLVIIFISGLFPLASGSLYAFGIDPVQGMDTSPFGFLFTNIMLILGFSHYQLLDLVPVAQDLLLRQVQDGMMVIDWKDRVVDANKHVFDILHLPATNIIGKRFQEVLPWDLDLNKMSKFTVPTEYCLCEPENYYVDLQVSSLTPHTSAPAGYLLAFRDISIRKQTELQLKKANASLQKQIQETNRLQEMLKAQATHDSLTGLYNRRDMDAVLNQILLQAQQQGNHFSIMVMDIDHFKEINDQFGHQTGDSILQQFGQAILQSTRDSDYSFRLGGDEILVAFPGMSAAEAHRKANLFREALQSIIIEKDNARVSTTVSVGIAEYPTHGDNVQILINRADRALYRAKEKGRNQVLVADLSKQED
jgi:diguanylate cyclase (GGDEF)-like protein